MGERWQVIGDRKFQFCRQFFVGRDKVPVGYRGRIGQVYGACDDRPQSAMEGETGSCLWL